MGLLDQARRCPYKSIQPQNTEYKQSTIRQRMQFASVSKHIDGFAFCGLIS